MSEIKVCEYFQLPLEPIDYQNGIIDCNGFGVLFADLHEKEKEALCVAVNNHDRLTSENARLREALRAAMKFIDSHVADYDITTEMTDNYDALVQLEPKQLLTELEKGDE